MRKLIIGASIALATTSCAAEVESTERFMVDGVTLQIENDEVHPTLENALGVAATAFEDFVEEFECGQDEVILQAESIPGASDGRGASELGGAVTNYYESLPPEITLNSDLFLNYNVTDHQTRILAAHEFAHACGGTQRKLETPISTDIDIDLNYVLGFGLSTHSIYLEQDNIERYEVIALEEGFASAITAHKFGLDTAIEPPYYRTLRENFESMLQNSGMSYAEAQDYHEQSDIEGFVGQIVGKTREQVTVEDIVYVISWAQQ